MNSRHFLLFLCSVVNYFFLCDTYRILCVFPYNAKSHNIIFDSLIKGLAQKGHQVDVISHFPLKKEMKNYHSIMNLNGTINSLMNNVTIELATTVASDIVKVIVLAHGNNLCDIMGLDEFQRLIKNPPKNPPYDLIITEAFAANCFMGLGYVFKVPVVAVSSAAEYPWISDFIGNAENLAIAPNAFEISVEKMNFWERLRNVYSYYVSVYKFRTLTDEVQTNAMKKYLSPDIPHIRNVEKNVALTLVNSHPILFGVKPITPALVQIAGLHIDDKELTLSEDLKKWMENSHEGVVYFSFGSMVLIETLPKKVLADIYDSLKKIAPVRVLMKIVDKSKLPPGLPDNIKTISWIPQQSILGHKNTKAFITHGGLGGVQEALYFGVPMIGIPLFGDQFRNVEALVSKKMAIRIDLDRLTKKSLDNALAALLQDASYRDKAKYYSNLFKDDPMGPMERAIFWIEYVIRNGPDPLRSAALKFTWWQLSLLDVYGFILFIFLIVFTTVLICTKILIKFFINTMYTLSKNRTRNLEIYEKYTERVIMRFRKKREELSKKKK